MAGWLLGWLNDWRLATRWFDREYTPGRPYDGLTAGHGMGESIADLSGLVQAPDPNKKQLLEPQQSVLKRFLAQLDGCPAGLVAPCCALVRLVAPCKLCTPCCFLVRLVAPFCAFLRLVAPFRCAVVRLVAPCCTLLHSIDSSLFRMMDGSLFLGNRMGWRS